MDACLNDDAKPVLVQFEHGLLNEGMKDEVKFKYLRSKAPSSKKRMLEAVTKDLSYSGTVTKKQQSLMRYYIGFVDINTNCLKEIVPCQHCILKPKLRARLDATDSGNLEEKTFKQKSDNLVESFGTAKQKRLVASRKKNEGVHATISDKVSEVAKKIITKTPPSTPTSEDIDEIDGEDSIIPPVNKEATVVEDMYNVDDLISFQEYSCLRSLSKEVVDCDNETLMKWKTEQTYPEFVLHHLCNLPSHAKRREEIVCYLLYLKELIFLFKLTPKNLAQLGIQNKLPAQLKPTLLEKFTVADDRNKRSMPKKCKDKLLSHLLILSLMVENFEMNCNLLMKDLKIGASRITKILRTIGCTVKTSGKRKSLQNDNDQAALDMKIHATLRLPKPHKTKEESGVKKDSKSDSVKKDSSKKSKEQPPTTPDVKEEPQTPIKAQKKSQQTPRKSLKKQPEKESTGSPKKRVKIKIELEE